MSSGWTRYPTASSKVHRNVGWKRLRRRALIRDRHECQIRDPKVCTGTADAVDLIIPFHRGGIVTLDNCQAVCLACHRLKTAREAAQAKRDRRRRKPPMHPADVLGGAAIPPSVAALRRLA
jgi:5-methylcytosine-specific restriction protein A